MYRPVPFGTAQTDQKHTKVLLFTLATLNAKTYTLPRLSAKAVEAKQREREAATDTHILPEDVHIITGQAMTQFWDRKNVPYVCNVNVKDASTGQIIFQWFAPSLLTSLLPL